VQPRAEINSACYCDHVRCWNKDYCQTFVVCRKTTSRVSRTEHWHIVHATLLLTCTRMCKSSLPPKLASSSLNLNPVDYSVWRTLQQMVYHHKISHIDWLRCMVIDWWTQLSQDTLNQVVNQLPKRLMMVIKAKGAHVKFCLDKFCVHMMFAVTFTVCSSKILSKIHVFCQI